MRLTATGIAGDFNGYRKKESEERRRSALFPRSSLCFSLSFAAEEAQLVSAINQTMPGIQPDSTKTWTTKEGTRVSLFRWVQSKYKTDDQLLIYVYVNKKITGNKQANIDHILAKYTAAVASTNSTHALTAYCKTAFFKIYSEGLSYQDAATTVLPLFQATTNKNLTAGFKVFSTYPGSQCQYL